MSLPKESWFQPFMDVCPESLGCIRGSSRNHDLFEDPKGLFKQYNYRLALIKISPVVVSYIYVIRGHQGRDLGRYRIGKNNHRTSNVSS